MKTLHIYIIAATLLLFSACESELMKTTIGSGTAPELTGSSADIVLEKSDSGDVALSLNWTDPGYLADTEKGNVVGAYVIDIDKDASFSAPKSYSAVNTYNISFSVYELNKLLLDLECEPDVANQVYVRVKSIYFSSDTLDSNVLNLSVTPYSTYIPPAIEVPEELWISGEALTTGWNQPFLPEQQFTKETDTKFSITIALLATQNYEMIADAQGLNWTPCYRIDPELTPADMIFEGTFVWDGEGSDYGWGTKKFLSPADPGIYKISLEFQTATYTVVLQ